MTRTEERSKTRTGTAAVRSRRSSLLRGAMLCCTVLLAALLLSGCGGEVTSSSPDPAPDVAAAGSATLSWAAPTTYVDGTPLNALDGYKVYYGTTPGSYTAVVVGNVQSYLIGGLTKGTTYYFTVTAYDVNGIESDYAAVVSKLIL